MIQVLSNVAILLRLLKTGKQSLILTGRNGRGNCIAVLAVTLSGFKGLAPSHCSLVSECLLGVFILLFLSGIVFFTEDNSSARYETFFFLVV